MNKKTHFPIALLKSFEPFVDLVGERFKIIESEKNTLHISDIDKTSGFYFKIFKIKSNPNQTGLNLQIVKTPESESSNNPVSISIDIKQLQKHFDFWLSLIEKYETIASFFDDSIIKLNAERFLQKFEIPENAHKETFDLDQQLYLDEYLDNSKDKLVELKQDQPKEKVIEIEILEKEIEEIKSVLTTESKKKIMIRLSRLWGRAQKIGLPIIKAIFTSVMIEYTKKIFLE